MGRFGTVIVTLCLAAVMPAAAQTPEDEAEILATFDAWDAGWRERDVDLAIRHYADDVDWTNAFGDRFEGKAALREGLARIFALDFVMAGNSAESEYRDVQFLSSDIALVRSKLVRRGQKRPSGAPMPDRHINHLRVFHKRDGEWVIVSHLVSQAQEKGG